MSIVIKSTITGLPDNIDPDLWVVGRVSNFGGLEYVDSFISIEEATNYIKSQNKISGKNDLISGWLSNYVDD